MPKMCLAPVCGTRARVGFFLFASVVAAAVYGQDLPKSPEVSSLSGTLRDGQTRLERAAKLNGLESPEALPYHLKLGYQIFDSNSAVKDNGTIEVFWASRIKYRIVYSSPNFSQVLYGTKFGLMRSGESKPRSALLGFIGQNYLEPISNVGGIAGISVEVEHRAVNGSALECLSVSENFAIASNSNRVPGYSDCVDPHSYALKAKVFDPHVSEDFFDNPVLFRGRYLPGELRIIRQGTVSAVTHLESIEELSVINEADFIVPADAISMAARLPDDVVQGLLVKKVDPKYPKQAKKSKVQGTVIIRIVIGKDGHVSSVEAVSGPPELQEAVIEAVKQWVYKPYMLNGEPVEVDSTITSVFKIGR
jgi:TonB family protein